MTKFLTSLFASMALFLAPVALATSAAIDQAKGTCLIGEQIDGYIGFKSAPSIELKREVDEVNLQRRALYARLAQERGVSVAATAQLTAERLINQAPSGHCYKDANGAWQRKG